MKLFEDYSDDCSAKQEPEIIWTSDYHAIVNMLNAQAKQIEELEEKLEFVMEQFLKESLTSIVEEAKSDVMKVVDNYDGLPLHKKELKELFNSEK